MTIKRGEVLDQGIILSSRPYREHDALVTVYFRQYGKMTLLARGVKKLKSKNAPALMTMTLSEITFIPKQGLSTLIKASAIEFYRYLKEDIVLETYASYMMEYVLKNEVDNDPQVDVYHYLQQSLHDLNIGYYPSLIYLCFNAFVLKHNGTDLTVDGCYHCHHTSVVGVSVHGGGFVCQSCISVHDKVLPVSALKLLRHIFKMDIDDIDKITYSQEDCRLLEVVIDGFIDEYTGLSLKSRKMLRQIINL